jgi:hypothetical protein
MNVIFHEIFFIKKKPLTQIPKPWDDLHASIENEIWEQGVYFYPNAHLALSLSNFAIKT